MTKRNKKEKALHETIRNWIAVEAHFTTGAGNHNDRRSRRRRTRNAQKKAALAEYC